MNQDEIALTDTEIHPELLQETENFYRIRVTENLHSLKRTLEAQMGSSYAPEISRKLEGVQVALESITPEGENEW